MARVSIYVPDELKGRMDRAGELNWSAAAQRAFEVEISSQRWKMETDVIEKAVARLRTSRDEYAKQWRLKGKAAGREWALNQAEYQALKAVADHQWAELPAEERAQWLCALVLGDDDDPSEQDVKEFWETLFGDRLCAESEWVDGYIEGALDVWEEIADKGKGAKAPVSQVSNEVLAKLMEAPAVPTVKAPPVKAQTTAPVAETPAPAPTTEAPAKAKAKGKSTPANARFIVRITGKGVEGARPRFIEHRGYHTPWRHQARQFDTRELAEAWKETLVPEDGQDLDVVPYAGVGGKPPYQQANADSLNWSTTPKVGFKEQKAAVFSDTEPAQPE